MSVRGKGDWQPESDNGSDCTRNGPYIGPISVDVEKCELNGYVGILGITNMYSGTSCKWKKQLVVRKETKRNQEKSSPIITWGRNN